ncbi:MAG TPA: TonB-dependent receptor [Burkholderiales bacterium]|nr:TonB-dependent receptor [Burkholderiales bacterium]
MSPIKIGRTLLAISIMKSALTYGSTVYKGQDFVVTATRTPEAASNTTQDVTVISSAELLNSGQRTLGEVLQMTPGIEMAQTGGAGQTGSIFMRGTNSNQTLILLDGVPINTGSIGTASFNIIPVNEIDHIEILQGPASSLYGANAIGGVIQIFTKKGRGTPHPYISAGMGSYNTSRISTGYEGQKGNLSFNILGGHDESTSISQTNSSNPFSFNPDTDPYRNNYVSGQLSYLLAPGQKLGIVFLRNHATVFNDDGIYGPTSLQDHTTTTVGNYEAYSRNRINPYWVSQVHFDHSVDNEYTQTANPFSSNGSINNTQNEINWQNDFSTSLGVITLGEENQWQSVGGSATTFVINRRTNSSLFGAYHENFGPQSFMISGRHDQNSQFGGQNTGTVGYGYRLTPDLRVTATIGTAFRAPTFDDLYAVYPYYIANPNLKPEFALDREVGLHYSGGHSGFSLIYFDNKIRNLITGYTDTNFNYVMTNVGSARIKGLEIGYDTKLKGFRFHSSITFQQPINEDTNTLLGRRARQHGFIRVSRNFNRWGVGVETVFSGKRYDSSVSNSSSNRLGGYGIANLTATYRVNSEFSWYSRWDNIFNKQYELAQGYNTPGSNIFVGFNYSPD